jgi:hypothetical protein
MSIKVLADKVLAFDRGELDRNGILVTVRTKIGFNELPDWVGQTDFFKAAQNDGSLKAFTSSADSEEVLKAQEKLAALKDEIKSLEEQRDLLKSNVNGGSAEEQGAPTDSASPAATVATDQAPTDTKTVKPSK